jgi:hypothetical protein
MPLMRFYEHLNNLRQIHIYIGLLTLFGCFGFGTKVFRAIFFVEPSEF